MDDIKVQSELQPLYDYLAGRGSFVNLDNYRPEYLHDLQPRRAAADRRQRRLLGGTWSPRRSPS